MGIRITRWHDLSRCEIDIARQAAMIAELSELHIRKFRITIQRFGVRTIYLRIPRHDYGELEVSFDHNHQGNEHIITMRGIIYLGTKRVEVVVRGAAEYEYGGYDMNIQDYLYTYFYNMVTSSSYLKRFGPLDLPSKMSNYYPGCEWSPYAKVGYHRETVGQPLTVVAVTGAKTIPTILNIQQAGT